MILVGWVGINASSLIRVYVQRIRLSLFKFNTKWTALRSKSTQTNPPREKIYCPLGRPSSISVTINNQRRSKGTKRLKTRHIPFWFFARVISFSLHLFLSHFISIIFEREREREDQSFSAYLSHHDLKEGSSAAAAESEWARNEVSRNPSRQKAEKVESWFAYQLSFGFNVGDFNPGYQRSHILGGSGG